jgi:hypothetical protein
MSQALTQSWLVAVLMLYICLLLDDDDATATAPRMSKKRRIASYIGLTDVDDKHYSGNVDGRANADNDTQGEPYANTALVCSTDSEQF